MSAKKPTVLDVALGKAFGEATFEWGIVVVSPGFNKMEATTIKEVTGDVRHDLLVPDGLSRSGCGPAEGRITEDMDSLNRFRSLVTLLSSVPLLDSLKFEGDGEEAVVFSRKTRVGLDGFAKMSTVSVGESAQ